MNPELQLHLSLSFQKAIVCSKILESLWFLNIAVQVKDSCNDYNTALPQWYHKIMYFTPIFKKSRKKD